jgi:hypothetical protein
VICSALNTTLIVTTASVYGARAQALRVFRETVWVDEIGTGLAAVTVLAK